MDGRGQRSGSVAVAASLVVAAIGAGCGGGASGDDWGGTVDTLPGGAVHVTSPAEGLWDETSRWRFEPGLSLGSLDAEGPEMFGNVGDVAVGPDGAIYVAEGQAGEVRVFDAEGEYVRTIGRAGEGPGELNLRFGGEVVPTADVIWVNNSGNRRWDAFSPEGDHLGSTPVRTSFFGAETWHADGSIYVRDRLRGEAGEARNILVRYEIRGTELVPVDTLDVPELPESETVTATLSNGGARVTMALPVPFVHQPSWRFDPRARFWVDLADGYRLIELSAELDTLRIIERDYAPVPVSDEAMARELEQFTTGPLADAVDLDRSRVPDHHPPFDRFRTDTTGRLWVLRETARGEAWEVFDQAGRYLGEVASDVDVSRLTVHAITDRWVYGVLLDDLDVPSVVRLRIRKGA